MAQFSDRNASWPEGAEDQVWEPVYTSWQNGDFKPTLNQMGYNHVCCCCYCCCEMHFLKFTFYFGTKDSFGVNPAIWKQFLQGFPPTWKEIIDKELANAPPACSQASTYRPDQEELTLEWRVASTNNKLSISGSAGNQNTNHKEDEVADSENEDSPFRFIDPIRNVDEETDECVNRLEVNGEREGRPEEQMDQLQEEHSEEHEGLVRQQDPVTPTCQRSTSSTPYQPQLLSFDDSFEEDVRNQDAHPEGKNKEASQEEVEETSEETQDLGEKETEDTHNDKTRKEASQQPKSANLPKPKRPSSKTRPRGLDREIISLRTLCTTSTATAEATPSSPEGTRELTVATSRRGRKLVPVLAYWSNQNPVFNGRFRSLIGISEAISPMPEYLVHSPSSKSKRLPIAPTSTLTASTNKKQSTRPRRTNATTKTTATATAAATTTSTTIASTATATTSSKTDKKTATKASTRKAQKKKNDGDSDKTVKARVNRKRKPESQKTKRERQTQKRKTASEQEKKRPSQRKSPTNATNDEQPNPEDFAWTKEQVKALLSAQRRVTPSRSSFWDEVALCVPGKNAKECFEKYQMLYPAAKKATRQTTVKEKTKAQRNEDSPLTLEGYNLGTNRRKRKLRQMLEKVEKGHNDDIFQSTPFRKQAGLVEQLDALLSSEDEEENDNGLFTEEPLLLDPEPVSSLATSPAILKPVDRDAIDGYINKLQK
ncbi:hypothetical protein QOT17_024133, partial [Balamuthia mandrillaris]